MSQTGKRVVDARQRFSPASQQDRRQRERRQSPRTADGSGLAVVGGEWPREGGKPEGPNIVALAGAFPEVGRGRAFGSKYDHLAASGVLSPQELDAAACLARHKTATSRPR